MFTPYTQVFLNVNVKPVLFWTSPWSLVTSQFHVDRSKPDWTLAKCLYSCRFHPSQPTPLFLSHIHESKPFVVTKSPCWNTLNFKSHLLHQIAVSSILEAPSVCPPNVSPSQKPGAGSADRALLPAARHHDLRDAPSTWNLSSAPIPVDVGRSAVVSSQRAWYNML